MTAETTRARAFGVPFKGLRVWSPNSFFQIEWQWPKGDIKPLSVALKQKRAPIDKTTMPFSSLRLMTLHFDGTMEPRRPNGKEDFAGSLFIANPGDVVYSKIDVRNGAIGVVPDEIGTIAVSSEFPVYAVNAMEASPEYIKLLFRSAYFRQAINSMISGASGRKRVAPSQLISVEVPLPAVSTQAAIVTRWELARKALDTERIALRTIREELDEALHAHYYSTTRRDILLDRWLAIPAPNLTRWDVKTARASAFRISNPSFVPLGQFAEESTELVRPWESPDASFPVYGVNNVEGIFFSHMQTGRDFNAPYKRIREGWFFHNPTRSSVGSLGIVPEVPDDAVTSPEYQVWRAKEGMVKPDYIAMLISTSFFRKLIQFHRVGAVKQRLFVENLLEICVPPLPTKYQHEIAQRRKTALRNIAQAKLGYEIAVAETEALITGAKKIQDFPPLSDVPSIE